MESSPPESSDLKAAFRKPSNDAAYRNYRRHSPTDGSSYSDEHDHSSSPQYTREDPVKGRDYRERKKDDEKDLPRDSSRHQGRSGDSYRYSERRSSKSFYTQSRHDDHRRRESDHNRLRDYTWDRDKYSQNKYESKSPRSKDREKETFSVEHEKCRVKETHRSGSGRRRSYFEESERDRNDRHREDRDKKRESRRSSVDHWSGWDKEESRGHHSGSTAGREQDGQKLVKERNLESDSVNSVDRFDRGFKNPFDDKSIFEGDRNIPTKKSRLFISNGVPGFVKNDDGMQKSEEVDKANSAQASANASEVANDLNAAKFAAMRAAELVNRNLAGGTSCMSNEQKKKLLWGNKKSSSAEESSSQWNVSLISDPERQEKFNKLMGAKGDMKSLEQKPRNEDGSSSLVRAEKQEELQVNLEKQYIAGLRRRDGRTVGLGL